MKINKKGFTLIELLVVIAIIGLLSTLAVVSLSNARLKARNAKRMSDLKQISTAIELYSSDQDTSAYPTNRVLPALCGIAGIIADPDTAATPDALCGAGFAITDGTNTYLASIPVDPGATTYGYECDTAAGTCDSAYCISANLENSGFFICKNGSCFERATDCSELGI